MKKEVSHVTKLRIRQPDGESVDLSSSDNFMWSEPLSYQLTIHMNNLVETYGREAVTNFVTSFLIIEKPKRKKSA